MPRRALLALAPLTVAALIACGQTPTTATASSSATPMDGGPPPAAANLGVDSGDSDASAASVPGAAPAASASAATIAPAPAGMALVPGGPFTMGADRGGEEDEHPAHTVTVASFYLDVNEVTHGEYEECVAAKVCPPQSPAILAKFGGLFHAPKKPVDGVSAFDAEKYCAWKGKRLPREAEYERAVRGDDARKYPWGNDAPSQEKSVYQTKTTAEVGSKPAGRGPYGHNDLNGNIWEWLADDYDPYAYKRPTADKGIPGTCAEILKFQNELRAKGIKEYTGSNPIPTECERNIRGGAYNYGAEGLRSSNRIHHPASFRLLMTGFRCAKSVEATP